jgi:hypothetical protein
MKDFDWDGDCLQNIADDIYNYSSKPIFNVDSLHVIIARLEEELPNAPTVKFFRKRYNHVNGISLQTYDCLRCLRKCTLPSDFIFGSGRTGKVICEHCGKENVVVM